MDSHAVVSLARGAQNRAGNVGVYIQNRLEDPRRQGRMYEHAVLEQRLSRTWVIALLHGSLPTARLLGCLPSHVRFQGCEKSSVFRCGQISVPY